MCLYNLVSSRLTFGINADLISVVHVRPFLNSCLTKQLSPPNCQNHKKIILAGHAWHVRRARRAVPARGGSHPPDPRGVQIWPNLMKICQNMTKFYENQWFWVEKYDSGVNKMIFVVKKHVFIMILGTKMENLKNVKILFFSKLYFWQEIWFQWSWGLKTTKMKKNKKTKKT